MALETGTYISDLVITNPPGSDPKSQMDDHLRLIKTTIKNSFTGITGAVTMTHTELNTVTARGLIAGQTWTGTHTFPATTYGVTAAFGASGTAFATLDFVNAVASSAILPGQTSKDGKFLRTNGTTDDWSELGIKGSDIASAATLDLSSADGDFRHITGTTNITAITIPSGAERTLVFDGALTVTHHSTTLILPGGVSLTTAAGDAWRVRGDGTGNARVIAVNATSGMPVGARTVLCTSQLDKTSDTALVDIPGFSVTLVAGATYKFKMYAFTTASGPSGGMTFGFAGTATATRFTAGLQWQPGGSGYTVTKITSLASIFSNAQNSGSMNVMEGVIVVNAGGTFKIQFAQHTSNATPSTVFADSMLTFERLA